jgi:hypothetical protein
MLAGFFSKRFTRRRETGGEVLEVLHFVTERLDGFFE